MKVHFKSKKLKKLLESDGLKRKYGLLQAQRIVQRIEELIAADNLSKMPPAAKAHPLSNNRKAQYGIWLKHPFRLVIEALGEFDPNDISSMQEVKIIEIIDYH